MIVKTLVDWATHVTTVIRLSDGSWFWPETKKQNKKQQQINMSQCLTKDILGLTQNKIHTLIPFFSRTSYFRAIYFRAINFTDQIRIFAHYLFSRSYNKLMFHRKHTFCLLKISSKKCVPLEDKVTRQNLQQGNINCLLTVSL